MFICKNCLTLVSSHNILNSEYGKCELCDTESSGDRIPDCNKTLINEYLEKYEKSLDNSIDIEKVRVYDKSVKRKKRKRKY